ncbi:hypothetical protein PVAND_012601 [Polypedilum vanderplanki]|uniref:Uncharacterized protein n=1 Tax=Polypedilum vanderplanki TaxID=319348 RepID=A0A9J6CNV2_POLVA|nr:hypothetical protein PVAND_012601 [Polypedilum vanderplanki]
MSNKQQIDKIFLIFLTLLILIYGITAKEIYEDNNGEEELQMPLTEESVPMSRKQTVHDNGVCHVEFTVLKKSLGHCVKIGKTMRACISGTYFHPYHPDCI